jgi:pimeloyl-ACP methyl ester carboxylesterase
VAPAVVLVHGGFWRARWTAELMVPLARDLDARGFRAVNLEYRRMGRVRRGDWRHAVADVVAGVEAAGPCGVVGHSAGGHLALLAAAERPQLVRAVVAQAAVADVAEADRLRIGGGVTRRFLRGDPAADPARRAPTGVPTLLVHGTADPDVPPSLSERYAARAGAEATLELREGEGHFEHLDPASGAWASAVAFLEAHVRHH